MYTAKTDIVSFVTKVRNCVSAMQCLKQTGHLHNPDLLKEIIAKMPPALIYEYNRFVNANPSNEPRLLILSEFLYREAEMACVAGTSGNVGKATKNILTTVTNSESDTTHPNKKPKRKESPKRKSKQKKCLFCENTGHYISVCWKFGHETVNERWKWAGKSNSCFKCLARTHKISNCKFQKSCSFDGCKKGHHQRLHFVSKKSQTGKINLWIIQLQTTEQ